MSRCRIVPCVLGGLRGVAFTGFLALLIVGCDNSDPSVQAELIQLKAERTQLKREIQKLESSLEKKNQQISSLQQDAEEVSGEAGFDKQKSITEFIEKVAELKAELARKHPGASLSDAVQLPSFEAPLQGEVRIDVSAPGKPIQSFFWTGRGKLSGDWSFGPSSNQPVASVGSGSTDVDGAVDSGTTNGDEGSNNDENSGAGGGTGLPNGVPVGSRKIREDANGAVWETPDGRYIIKLRQQ